MNKLALLLVSTMLFAPAARAQETPGAPFYPPFGYDLTAMDQSVKPGDDFFQFANGAYLTRTRIPADRPFASRRYEMTDRTEAQLKTILEEASRQTATAPSDVEGKVGAFYAAYMDEARIEALGARAIAPELDAIRKASDLEALARLMGRTGGSLYPSPFAVTIETDLKNPNAYALYIGQNALGLPDRDYYLEDDFAKEREAYRHYAAELLKFAGWPDAAESAERVVAFETALANASWTKVQQRDLTAQYHPVSQAALAALAPSFPWTNFLGGAAISDRDRFIVTTDTAMPKLAAVIAATPLETVKAWMAFRVTDTAAPYLPSDVGQHYFQFREKTLAGQMEPRPRWKRGMAAVGGTDCVDASICLGTLNWAVGQLYAKRYFPPATKASMNVLIANLTQAFRARIQALDWMSPTTKREALNKLNTYNIKVGYPDTPRDYSRVEIRRDDLLGNVRRAADANWSFYVNRSSGPVDKSDWLMTPQTNNAYNGSLRDIVFPAAILQAPIFDPNADPAINYGAVGGVIGHELTHGFDDQGRTIDAAGALRDWWTPEDAAKFNARADVLGAQYAKYEPVKGTFINPKLTMGENLADLGGLAMALDAYHLSLKGKPAPVINGLTGDQRVFLGWAQAWAGKGTDEAIRNQTISDPHSWRKFRVNGVVRNLEEWYAAFGIKPGDALYIPPDKRARVW